MVKNLAIATALAVGIGAPATASQAAMGPDAAACGADRPAVLVNVSGFKARSGELRVQLYGANPADFLAKGKKLRRIDLPVAKAGPMAVCVAVPAAGRYAIAVRHDVTGNGSDWNDGGGFSNNPKLSITSYKPKYNNVAFLVGNATKPINVVLNYRRGLSVGPIAG